MTIKHMTESQHLAYDLIEENRAREQAYVGRFLTACVRELGGDQTFQFDPMTRTFWKDERTETTSIPSNVLDKKPE